jgi:hypothetical protein
MVDNKKFRCIIAFLPVFTFALLYFTFQYFVFSAFITVSPFNAMRPFITLILFMIGCSFIAKKFIKNNNIAGFVLLISTELLIFSERFFIISGIISCLSILLWVGITFLRKKKILLDHISFLLVSLSLAMTIVYSFSLISIPWNIYLRQIMVKKEKPSSSLLVSSAPPDIYFIILDGYVRSDVLRELYGFDNYDFTNYLMDNNFIIPENNHSNYAKTALSVTSTLNMQYIQTLFPDAEQWPFWWLMAPFIKNSQVKMMLEDAGYKTVAIASEWDITNIDNVDIYLKPLPIRLNDFEKFLVQSSPLSLFDLAIEKFTLLNTYSSHRKMIDFDFKALSEIPNFNSPKFVFAHIIAPHPPFVFDRDGKSVAPLNYFSLGDANDFQGSLEQYRNGYVDQLQYINLQMETVIDSILKKSKNLPIIIILGDHGSGMLTDFSSSANSCMRERFSNFIAFYLPGMNDDDVPSDISSVNIFRLIFNRYFATEFDILNNEYYFSRYPAFIYQYEDISSRLNMKCEISP